MLSMLEPQCLKKHCNRLFLSILSHVKAVVYECFQYSDDSKLVSIE